MDSVSEVELGPIANTMVSVSDSEEELGSRAVHDTVDLNQSSQDARLNSILNENAAEDANSNASSSGPPADQSCQQEVPAPARIHKMVSVSNSEEELGSSAVHDTVDLNQSSHHAWLSSILNENVNINRQRRRDEWLNSILNAAEDANNNASSSGPPADQSCQQEVSALARIRIHKVHQMLRETIEFETYYVPRVVSIGPYHYSNQKLHPMNKLKLIFARELVSNNRQKLGQLYQGLLANIKQVKDCYENNSTNGFSDEEFTMMMLLDGCFIWYFIEHYCISGSRKEITQMQAYYISFVEEDLLLLENQLPFPILEWILNFTGKWTTKKLMMMDVMGFIEHICIMVPPRLGTMEVVGDIEKLNPPLENLLDILHKTMVGFKSTRHEQRTNSNREANSNYTVRNVMELKEAGIKLKLSKTSCLTDIRYRPLCCSSGCLRLPPITVDGSTRVKLMNLIAYEMYCPVASNDKWVTCYVCFLDSLIDHADDVKALRSTKILRNRLGSDDEVAKLFNEIGKGLVPHPCAYSKVKGRIQRHYDNKVLNYMAELKQQHFKNPWTIIALNAGILLLFFTAVQAYFQVWPLPNECDRLCKYIKTNHHI